MLNKQYVKHTSLQPGVMDILKLNDNDYNENSDKKEKVFNKLEKIFEYGLTRRQRKCLELYYYEKRPMKEIAFDLSLNISTVWKHIKRAEKKVFKTLFFNY